MVNAKNVLKTICFALFLLFAAGLTIGHYSGFWPRLRIFWHLDSQIPAVQAAMKEYLQKKYDENFEVERPEILYDCYGCRLSTKASPADNPDLKFAISTDHYRFRDPFHPEDLFKNFHDSFCGARWGFRRKEYEQRLEMFLSRPTSNSLKEEKQFTLYIEGIEGAEQEFNNLDLFRMLKKYTNKKTIPANEKLAPSVYYETIIYTDQEIDIEAEAERFSILFNEHFLKCKTDHFIIAILYYWQNKRAEIEAKIKYRFWMNFVSQNKNLLPPPDRIKGINSLSFQYSHFREALDVDHKAGKLKNAFIISSYDCQGEAISKEQIIKSFLY